MQQVASHQTSLRLMQLKRCPSFTVFDECFGCTPNVNPVHAKEIGSNAEEVASEESLEDSQVEPDECIR